jgi:carnitine O-acetyltransferase
MYALYCLLQRELSGDLDPSADDAAPVQPSSRMSEIFTDPGYHLLSNSVLSTSNCGNPALRLFGFGANTADGYGLGYIIKEDGISVYVLSLICGKMILM